MINSVGFNRISNTNNCKFLLRKILPQELEPIEAEVRASEQDVQPYFEHRLWSEFCCGTQIEVLYMNII